ANEFYVKTIVIMTDGTILELDQTPNVPQDLEFSSIKAYVNGSDVTYFGIGQNDKKLYRSNTIGAPGVALTFSEVPSAGVLAVNPMEFVVLKNGTNGVSIEVNTVTGDLYRTASATVGGNSYSAFTAVTGATDLVSID